MDVDLDQILNDLAALELENSELRRKLEALDTGYRLCESISQRGTNEAPDLPNL